MMIDRIGSYRGLVLEHAVNTSTNGFPQWVAKLQAAEMFDEEAGKWVSWAEYDMDITAYMVLMDSKGKPCMNLKQVCLATAWDGTSWAGLDQLDLSNIQVMFRVEEHTFKGDTRLQVNWVDHADANPLRSLRKLDTSALRALDGKFKLGKVAKPASAPKPPAPKPPAAPPKAPAPNAAPRTTDPADSVDEPPSPKPTPPAAPPKQRKKRKKADAPKTTGLAETCTKLEAWEKVAELKAEDCTDDMLSEAWLAACETIGKVGEDDFTPEDWAEVRDRTLDAIPSLPF